MTELSIKKGLSAIADEVLADIQKDVETQMATSKEEAKKILKTAREESDKNYQSIINQAKMNAEAEKRRIISLTEVETRSQLLETKQLLVNQAFNEALNKLNEFVKTDDYHQYLFDLIEKATKRIRSKKLIIHVNANDKSWLTQNLDALCRRLRLELQLSNQIENCIGGCKIETIDGRVIYDETFDNRLEELKPELRVEVAKILFGEEK
ncbi:MAG TPA: V-type ATP synthase subunit E family protein [Candidatus Sulfotelmatobacter sp.]|nr:V-type ATP synthase subunit E family protein [Candidatus Sulfotelmatobacter sp.]